MLKMILAEDEIMVRRGLKNVVKWEQLGIEIIAEAGNGEEAFELCQSLRPDIVFTDIRMPIMDGLELAVKLKESGSTSRIVFISGAQDFSYAKTALDVDADGYILKPVNVEELNQVFKKVTSWIRMERNKQTEVYHLKQQLREHLPLIREKFLQNLISGAYTNRQEIRNKLSYYNIPFNFDESILVAIMQIDDYYKETESLSEEDKQLLIFSISNIVEEIISNNNAGLSFSFSDNEFIILFNDSVQINDKYNEICEELVKCLNEFLKISVSIGIGTWVEGILLAQSSFKDARSALQYKFYTGRNSILNINDINLVNEVSLTSAISSDIYDYENQLMSYIKLGDWEGSSKIIDVIFDNLCSEGKMPVEYIQSICVEMVCMAARTIQSLGVSLNSVVGSQSAMLQQIYIIENSDNLKQYFGDIVCKISEHLSSKYNRKNSKVVNSIKEIIEQRYHEDISVAKIAEEIYLTPNYISMIFKHEVNETITEYIIKVRMEHAKNLLKTTDMKILEIAREVGYEDPHYFSKAFKKYSGTHPQKFRG